MADRQEPLKGPLPRNEWLAWRRTGIGGSDAPIIMGLSPYRGQLSLYVDKLDRGENPNEPQEAAMWGVKLEALVAERFAEVTGFDVREPERLERHPRYPFMIGTPDRYVYSRYNGEKIGILEVKTCTLRKEWEWDPEPNAAAVCQLRHYLAVTGMEVGWVAVLIGGQRYLHYEIRRDPDFERELIEKEAIFWWHVTNDVPPEPDGRDSTTAIINNRYGVSSPAEVVEFDGEARTALEQLLDIHKSQRADKREVERLKNIVKLALGPAEIGTIDGRAVVSWKGGTRERVDLKALRRDAPGLVEQYVEVQSLRTFRVHPVRRVDLEDPSLGADEYEDDDE